MKRYLSAVFRLVAVIILAQTLFFKFTGAEESKFIFSQLGVEPWGRYVAGMLELIAVVFFIFEDTSLLASVMSIVIMLGAIGAHMAVLGIEVQNDGGVLFGLAIAVLLSSVGYIWTQKEEILKIKKTLLTWED